MLMYTARHAYVYGGTSVSAGLAAMVLVLGSYVRRPLVLPFPITCAVLTYVPAT